MGTRAIAALFITVIVSLSSPPAFGDVAPDPGFTRITGYLKIETYEDFSDYRFFLRSGSLVQEVFFKKDEQTTVRPLGGGAFFSSGKILAVPTKELEKLNADIRKERLTELEQAVYDGTVPREIELIDHIFSHTVREAEESNFQDPLYRIERDPQAGLKAVYVSGGPNLGSFPAGQSSGRLFWQSAAAAIVAGIFLVFGITIFGILYFRKKTKSI